MTAKSWNLLFIQNYPPLRQKGREFFNINADGANTALLSIFEKQTEIKKVNIEEITPPKTKAISKNKARKRKHSFKRIDSEYAELLQLFASLLNVKGSPFGQLNKPSFGMSDGNEGVQWNLSASTDTNIIRLGVNLEGMKYSNWPISKFILSEIDNPKIDEITSKVNNPDNIFICFSRDAWQVTSRPTIIEKYLGGKEFSLAEMNAHQWLNILNEALGCLNDKSNYRSRAKQTVTLENKPRNGEQVRVMEVSPHLTAWSPLSLNGDMQKNLENKIDELKPVYDWIKEFSES